MVLFELFLWSGHRSTFADDMTIGDGVDGKECGE